MMHTVPIPFHIDMQLVDYSNSDDGTCFSDSTLCSVLCAYVCTRAIMFRSGNSHITEGEILMSLSIRICLNHKL